GLNKGQLPVLCFLPIEAVMLRITSQTHTPNLCAYLAEKWHNFLNKNVSKIVLYAYMIPLFMHKRTLISLAKHDTNILLPDPISRPCLRQNRLLASILHYTSNKTHIITTKHTA
ncbi:hypothetical protein ACJX0J_029708, partial [Zea mays]